MSTRRYGQYSFDASNEDKVLFPNAGVTKGDLIDYYERIAHYILPHTRNRPITMQRFPDGIGKQGFYEKRLPDHFPHWVTGVTVDTETDRGSQRQVLCNNRATLAYLANQACITPHVWLSRVDALDRPDQMIFDLDPPDGNGFDTVRAAARKARQFFQEFDTELYLKTTGSRGLHLVLPLKPENSFDDVRAVARDIADRLADRYPEELTTQARKNKRRGRLFLDTARNAYGQTAVAPYAVRAKPGAPVATPITWDELSDKDLHAQRYTMANIFLRLGRTGCPWSAFNRHRRSLDALKRALKKAQQT